MDYPIRARFQSSIAVDGDTIRTELVDLGYHQAAYRKIEYRLFGLDAPESNRPKSRKQGLAAKAFTDAWITEHLHGGKWLFAETRKVPGPDGMLTLNDSFGRYVATILCYEHPDDHPSLNQALLDAGLAVVKHYT